MYGAATLPTMPSKDERRDTDTAACDFDRELCADAAARLRQAILRMEQFLARLEEDCATEAGATYELAGNLCDEGRRLLEWEFRDVRREVHETALRSAYRLIAALSQLAAWSAPAAQESWACNSYAAPAARDAVAYARYGSSAIVEQERAYAAMLGVDSSQARLLLCSSGMAAYALVESFLLRHVLQPGDRVLLHPGVYFETRDQLGSLPFIEVRQPGDGSAEALLESLAVEKPAVVFVDPLSNTADLRMLNLPRLLATAERLCTRETWFVVDGTMLSGGFNAFAGTPRRHIQILYYESGCKYLQFGLDLGPSGVLVVDRRHAARFEHLRRGSGAIASELLALPRAARSAYLAYLRTMTRSAHAAAEAVSQTFADRASASLPLTAIFPSLPAHPDRVAARSYPHVGGVVCFRFADTRLNRRAPLETFVQHLMQAARRAQLALTAGVSFGFRVPRICAAWSSCDSDAAFLRLSAGTDPQHAARVGTLIARCAAEFAVQHARGLCPA